MKEKPTSLWQKLFGDSVRAFGVVSLVFLGFAGYCSGEKFLQRVASLSARLSQDDPQPQRCQHAAAAFSGRHPADLAARTRSGRSLHQLPRRTERSEPHRCSHPTVPHASSHPPQARSVRMHGVPSRTRRRHYGRRSAQQHAGVGAADSSREVHRVLVRRVPSRPAARHAAVESGTQSALALRLRALPHGEVAGRHHDEGHRRPAVALAHRRQDDARVDLRVAERSASLRLHGDHAELQAERRRRARHVRVPDRQQHVRVQETRLRFRRSPPRILRPAPASTANPSALPATRCRTPPEIWWVAMLDRS